MRDIARTRRGTFLLSSSRIGARASGKRAQEHLTAATTMYREMGMRFWLEQTEAEIGLLG